MNRQIRHSSFQPFPALRINVFDSEHFVPSLKTRNYPQNQFKPTIVLASHPLRKTAKSLIPLQKV